MNNYASPFERPLSRGTFDFCDGPGGRWAAWVASAGIRFGIWTPGKVLDDTFGNPNTLFIAGERPSKLSICFDHYQRAVIAIQKDDGNISVRFFVQADVLTTPISADMDTISVDSNTITADNVSTGNLYSQETLFVGQSPILFFNGNASIDPGNADAICFYLKGDKQTIYCRFIADNFGVEYTMNGGLPVNLVSLLKADLLIIGGRQFLGIWALTDDGRQVFVRAGAYAPELEDSLTPDQSITSGTYVNPNSTPTIHDDLTADVALIGSNYTPTVLPNSAPPDALTVDATISSGLYIATVLPSAPIAERLTLTNTIGSGSYA